MNRYYAASSGRFVSADRYAPSAVLYEPVSWNRYLYVKDDPINYVDPSGLCWIAGRWYADGGPQCPNVTSVTVTTSLTSLGPVGGGGVRGGGGGGGDGNCSIVGCLEVPPDYNTDNSGGGYTPPPEEPGMESQTANIVGAVMGGRLAGGVLGRLARLLGLGAASTDYVLATMTAQRLANTLNHIFGKQAHNLTDLVAQFNGSQTAAFNAIQQATLQAATAQNLPNGVFQIVVQVAGQNVTVRGNIINGAVNIGTAFIP